MIVPRLIERKRDGGRLEPQEIRELVLEYSAGRIPDYQVSALLMAMYFKGLDRSEMHALMEAMLESGKRLDLSRLPMARIDKLESIPGFRTARTLDDAQRQIARIGCAMIGQTDEMAPADQKIYALRDATATVEVIPLIAASIMSKKLAEGLTGLVLDIKRGSGSFLPKLEDELELAKAMIDLGTAHGCPVVALLTAMDRPLGYACGNALEVVEAIDVLKGGGPPDLIEVTMELGARMLVLGTVASTLEAANALMRDAIASGRALLKFEEIVAAQDGDAGVVRDPTRLPRARHQENFVAKRAGVVGTVEPRAIGYGIIALGGGRRNMEE